MARTTTETMGVCERVLEFIRTNQNKIAATGLDPAALQSALEADLSVFRQEESQQETLKATLREQTTKTRASKRKADKKSSDTIRVLAGALGSDTELGKQVQRLSSDIRRDDSPAADSSGNTPASG
jgi:hypothetical protein